ncbi:MAG: hypothetical protein AAF411_23165 [Myxococcota bacterium]
MVRLMFRVALALTTLSPWAASVHAQTVVEGPEGDPSMDDVAEARERFTVGQEAAGEGRWSDALRAFRRSYELSGIAAALYNTATTYRSIGRYRLARDTFVQLLRDHADGDSAMLESARSLRDEVAARVAVLSLHGLPESEPVSVRLDDRSRDDTGDRPLSLDVDEGEHTVTVDREGYLPFEWQGAVAGGDERRIDAEFVERPRQRNVGRIILFVSIGVAVVAGGVITALLLRDTGLSPETNRVFDLGDR